MQISLFLSSLLDTGTTSFVEALWLIPVQTPSSPSFASLLLPKCSPLQHCLQSPASLQRLSLLPHLHPPLSTHPHPHVSHLTISSMEPPGFCCTVPSGCVESYSTSTAWALVWRGSRCWCRHHAQFLYQRRHFPVPPTTTDRWHQLLPL